MVYPRNLALQAQIVHDWRLKVKAAGRPPQPVMQPLYVDLAEDPKTAPHPIHLGFRLGTDYLRAYLKSLEKIGINHVALNLRFNKTDIEQTIRLLAQEILPDFSST